MGRLRGFSQGSQKCLSHRTNQCLEIADSHAPPSVLAYRLNPTIGALLRTISGNKSPHYLILMRHIEFSPNAFLIIRIISGCWIFRVLISRLAFKNANFDYTTQWINPCNMNMITRMHVLTKDTVVAIAASFRRIYTQ